ncbi:MAG TPA: OsmC family peroxiredoxin [Gemmatimonadales bacterium]
MTISKASAVWEGKLKDGRGSYRASSGAFTAPYSFRTRFEGAPGSTPEELIAAAHAACYSMALSADLEKAGTPATRIETEAACTIEAVNGVPTITTMALRVLGTVAGVNQTAFLKAAEGTRDNCPVSRALKGNVRITLEASLQ